MAKSGRTPKVPRGGPPKTPRPVFVSVSPIRIIRSLIDTITNLEKSNLVGSLLYRNRNTQHSDTEDLTDSFQLGTEGFRDRWQLEQGGLKFS
jgi:hypothetical protein